MAQAEIAASVFADRLAESVERRRSQLVLGLDPVVDLLPVELQGDAGAGPQARADAVARFCRGLIDAAAPACVAVKPQLAFFEALGAHGMHAFEEESVEPFLTACKRHGAGLFIVAKTSNEGSADIQDLRLRDGDVVWHRVALLAREWGGDFIGERGLSSIGLVIGATYPRAVGEARRLCPQQVLLLPGVGAQGAGPAEIARAFTSGPASALVSVSRAIDYAFRAHGGDWRTAAGAEAARLRDEIWSVSGW